MSDLVKYAKDAVERGEDLYAILGVNALSEEQDIRKAYRRAALVHHPDKNANNKSYSPELFQRLERCRDVLLHAEARVAYDQGMTKLSEEKKKREAMSADRRKRIDDLFSREQAGLKKANMATEEPPPPPDADFMAMVKRGKAKGEERKRLMREAEEREQQVKVARGRERARLRTNAEMKAEDQGETREINDADDEEAMIELAKRRVEGNKLRRLEEKEARRAARRMKRARGKLGPG